MREKYFNFMCNTYFTKYVAYLIYWKAKNCSRYENIPNEKFKRLVIATMK